MHIPTPTPSKAARSPFHNKVVCVTGGAGFVGSHMCRRLLKDGAHVTCLDNLDTGRHGNIAALEARTSFSFIQHDINDPLPPGLPEFDYIFNLACPASPVHYQRDPVFTALTCSRGVFNLLERAHRDGALLLQASTSEIYGDPLIHPQPESYWGNVNSCGTRSCYDEGKRFAETLIRDFGTRYGVPIRIARIFNTYGPHMQFDDGRVVSNFVVQALKGQPLTIYGDGSQTRSFCYVDDLVEGLLRLAASRTTGPDPVNLGNPEEFTVGELAELVLSSTGSLSPLVHRPLPQDDPKRRRPDITRAKKILGWAPATPLSAGLLQTIDEFRQRLELSLPLRTAPAAAREVRAC
ncbi:UDP-glucuronic acid decarboxylase family protein [Nitratireductor basaltis]|uniref:NAD-dependent epimerase/dehydratase n=1 Tax=Nitratireductor basaltis TaxID=472175 RepID=A0A084U8H0_9HYPH|nr:UDP-glucuronic acid decarboxylase family protein [Nitratireductor basaltis]KFB09256.1 NAD-dependent epimerase/dehydratase [Nitratireductor basaltis]